MVIVAGMGRSTRAIGSNNGLIWHVPADMRRFKTLTLGHPVIMGRKTFESILAILDKPLPGRTTIVVTRNTDYVPEGVAVTHTLQAALERAAAESPQEIHIGGGAELYRQALPLTDRLHLTFFDDETSGDATFPDFADEFVIEKTHEPQQHGSLTYQWVDYVRRVN